MVASSTIVRRPSGEVLGTVIATHDVTPLSTTIHARDEYLKMLSHDLRSPLTSIIGYLEIIEDSFDVNAAGVAMEFAIIRRNAARLVALADDIRHTANAADQSPKPETEIARPVNIIPRIVDMHELRVSDAI
jgi:signal transduction histidine kinase